MVVEESGGHDDVADLKGQVIGEGLWGSSRELWDISN